MTGELRWVPAPPAWPWVVAAVVIVVPVLLAARTGRPARRRAVTAANLALVLPLAVAAHAGGDLRAPDPAPAAESPAAS